ncbi:MAG: two-component system response regulator [Spirochaetes bacterium GWF1_51_8]|nr:MAG: two-component system response regulator [Spirochaetes bacterium GWF1_51_8]
MNDKSILLVEDNPSDVELTKRAFKKSSVVNNLIVVNDGQEAIDYFFGTGQFEGRDTSIQPTVILLDLKLPKIDGITVLRRLKSDELTRKIPVVVLTTSSEDSDLEACYELGVNSYIRKPVDFIQFAEVVSQLGLYWMVLNEVPPKKR